VYFLTTGRDQSFVFLPDCCGLTQQLATRTMQPLSHSCPPSGMGFVALTHGHNSDHSTPPCSADLLRKLNNMACTFFNLAF